MTAIMPKPPLNIIDNVTLNNLWEKMELSKIDRSELTFMTAFNMRVVCSYLAPSWNLWSTVLEQQPWNHVVSVESFSGMFQPPPPYCSKMLFFFHLLCTFTCSLLVCVYLLFIYFCCTGSIFGPDWLYLPNDVAQNPLVLTGPIRAVGMNEPVTMTLS